jgi:hypothetical protein
MIGADYEYRLIVPKEDWAAALLELAMEQTWSSFKNEAARFARVKRISDGFVNALHKVWGIMYDLQQEDGHNHGTSRA